MIIQGLAIAYISSISKLKLLKTWQWVKPLRLYVQCIIVIWFCMCINTERLHYTVNLHCPDIESERASKWKLSTAEISREDILPNFELIENFHLKYKIPVGWKGKIQK